MGAASLAIALGCSAFASDDDAASSSGGVGFPGGGTSVVGPGFPAGGSEGVAVGGSSTCWFAQSSDAPLFDADQVRGMSPAPRVLYAWVTAEQAEVMRSERSLAAGSSGRGFVFEALDYFAAPLAPWNGGPELGAAGSTAVEEPGTEGQRIAKFLSHELFVSPVSAWSNPWGSRWASGATDPGGELVRIVLAEEAWVALFWGDALSVVDASGAFVPMEDVLDEPHRIGALFFLRDAASGGPSCEIEVPDEPREGYREFIVGNESMVAEWSLGTETGASSLLAASDDLAAYLELVRTCSDSTIAATFDDEVMCTWQAASPEKVPTNVREAYFNSLAYPNEAYVPSVQNLAGLVDVLRSAATVSDPVTVVPAEEEGS